MTHDARYGNARSVLLATAVLLVRPALLPAQPPDGRAPVPDEAAVREALALLKEVYDEEHERARSPPQKVALARKMITLH